jgi:hypothetical protein
LNKNGRLKPFFCAKMYDEESGTRRVPLLVTGLDRVGLSIALRAVGAGLAMH